MTSRTALGGNDALDWGQFGPQGTNLPPSFPGLTNLGASVIVSCPGLDTVPFRIDQSGPSHSGLDGNFTPGDRLLAMPWETTVIDFDHDIMAVGTQILPVREEPFMARIIAYDAAGTPLGLFERAGVFNNNADGSAIFIGVLSDSCDIRRVSFEARRLLHNYPDYGSYVNEVAILDCVPEPGTWTLAIGLVGLPLRQLRLKRKCS